METIQAAPNGLEISGVPSGCILMWSGPTSTIPNGWHLCDGSNGTPDLRNRFIVGAGSTYGTGATGGTNSVQLTLNQIPSHTHSGGSVSIEIARVSGASGSYEGIMWNSASAGWGDKTFSGSVTVGYTGNGDYHENRPPYYALCFIMKL